MLRDKVPLVLELHRAATGADCTFVCFSES